MLYSLVEMNRAAMAPLRLQAKAATAFWTSSANPARETQVGRSIAAAASVFERATRFYGKPEWQIEATEIEGRTHAVTPVTAWSSPWCQLVHFETAGAPEGRPDLIIVAPLSGHYATLLRGTVEAFLPTHNVYITDWTDARMAPVWFGRFDLDDYIDHVRDMLPGVARELHFKLLPPPVRCHGLRGEAETPVLAEHGEVLPQGVLEV